MPISQMQTVANNAALTALTGPTGLADDGVYRTLGRSSERDGGEGEWVYDSGSNASADSGTILAIDGGGPGRFFRLYQGPVDIRWFGAACNGSGDDSAAVAAAVATGKDVYFPPNATTRIGAGTPIIVTTNSQRFVTDAAPAAGCTIKLLRSIQWGTTSIRVHEVGWGDGFMVIGAPDVTLNDVVNARGFYIGKGRQVDVHTLLELGDASSSEATYKVHLDCEVSQRSPELTFSSSSGSFVVGGQVAGGSSGATASVAAWDATGKILTLLVTSETPFEPGETVTGAGATGTVSAYYRPGHLVKCTNFSGDFVSRETVEGSYDGASDGFHADSNVAARIDEIWIHKYWGRFRRNFSAVDARVVNVHLLADMENGLDYGVKLHVTSSTAKSAGSVGWSSFYMNRVKGHGLQTSSTSSIFYARCERGGCECEDLNLEIDATGAAGHGVFIQATAGEINGVRVRASGLFVPTASNRNAVYLIEDGGTINGVDIESHPRQEGATALNAAVAVSGSPQGIIRAMTRSGNVTGLLDYTGALSNDLQIPCTRNGMPIGGIEYGPPMSAANLPTGAGTVSLALVNNNIEWRALTDILIVGVVVNYSAAPTANTLDFAIAVDGSTVKGHTNTGVTSQLLRYFPNGTPVAVDRGDPIQCYVYTGAGYATPNVDVTAQLVFMPRYGD